MRIGVLGAGAIGTLFGVRLYQAGNDVTLYNHNRTIVNAVRKHGVLLKEKEGRSARFKVPIDDPPNRLYDLDLLLLTVKAYDTLGVARRYQGKISSRTVVMTLQNGLGNYETLAHHFSPGQVVAGSTTEAALAEKPGVVAHTGPGTTWIGEPDGTISERCRTISKTLENSGFRVILTRDMRTTLWSKAVVNSAVNPVSALTRLPNGRLEGISPVARLMKDVLREGTAVARAEGIPLDPETLSRFLRRVLVATAANKSSMLRDVENGRKTEINQLNGVIVELGKKHGVETPVNRFLLALIGGLEESMQSQAAASRT